MTSSHQKLLVIDDETNIRYSIKTVFESSKLEVMEAATAREGIALVQSSRPDAVLLDVRLPDMSGLDAFEQIHAIDSKIPVIMMTAFSKTETAIEAMRRGAFEYFVKPVDFNILRQAVERALHLRRLNSTPALLQTDVDEESLVNSDQIVGTSFAMQEVYKSIGRVAPQDVTVLILGESGTGKELVARSIYHYSKRNQKPFLAVNCAALTESLLESELFGHEKGAFTGADQRRIGKFEQVNGGTIFLDEVGDMTPTTQAKALRLLQQQQFERVGGTHTIQTDVRIIAATNKDLSAMVAAGTFREDLFYRLSGFTIRMPSLRERREDIPALVDYFVRVLSRDLNKPIHKVSDVARSILQNQNWPGNVRELFSAIRYAVVRSVGTVLTEECLPPAVSLVPPRQDTTISQSPTVGLENEIQSLVRQRLQAGSSDVYRELIQIIDGMIIEEVLKETLGNQLAAAERLGISRMTLRAKTRQMKASSESTNADPFTTVDDLSP